MLSLGQILKSRTVWTLIAAAAFNGWNSISGQITDQHIVGVVNDVFYILALVFRISPNQHVSDSNSNAGSLGAKMPLVAMAMLALIAAPAHAQTNPISATVETQDVPAHFMAAGLGFQDSTHSTSGWTSSCVRMALRTLTCLGTDYVRGTTATRMDVDVLLAKWHNFYVLGKPGVGVGTGVDNGVGGNFDFGGVIAYDLSKRFPKFFLSTLVFSGSWDKNNVEAAIGNGKPGLVAFGEQTIWRFGAGKSW